MNLQYSADEQAFRRQVCAAIEANLSPAVQAKVRAGREVSRQEVVDWARVLHGLGWAAPHWPQAHGGAGWTLVQQMIYRDVACELGAPEVPSFGVSMVGPVIYTFGSEAQQRRFLPRI